MLQKCFNTEPSTSVCSHLLLRVAMPAFKWVRKQPGQSTAHHRVIRCL